MESDDNKNETLMRCTCGAPARVVQEQTAAGVRYSVHCIEPICWSGPKSQTRAFAINPWNIVMRAYRVLDAMERAARQAETDYAE